VKITSRILAKAMSKALHNIKQAWDAPPRGKQESVMKYQEYELEATESENFMETVKDDVTILPMLRLTSGVNGV
jgi:hypothetical protein